MEEDPLSICYCGWGYNRPMIRCCHCKHWYHYDCVNVTRRILDDAEHWYCFECIDYKPKSENEDEDYDFQADLKRQQEMNKETRKGVKRMLEDLHFSEKSALQMTEQEIKRSICCIEQQLLLEDDTPLSHIPQDPLKRKRVTKYSLERGNRLRMISRNEIQRSFLLDTDRMGLRKCIFSIPAYLTIGEHSKRTANQMIDTDQQWMIATRNILNNEGVSRKCIPINADVRTFDWATFGKIQKSLTHQLFDVVMMDPPWQLTSDNPCRGVAIKYQQLDDKSIASLPLSLVQENGLLFLWAINCKYTTALQMLKFWGYELICDITWVKLSARGFVAQGNGFYLRHTKETCFVAKKGKLDKLDKNVLYTMNDSIVSRRYGQSQKPNEIYNIIEKLVPNGSLGYYLEIFGRLNNLRDNWVTIGNEI